MGDMLCTSSAMMNNTEDLLDIFPCRFDEVTLPMLGAAFFERGWLAPRFLGIHPTDTVALGDIGYKMETGKFVVVGNVHHSLEAESGTLSWKGHLEFHSGGEELEDTSAEIIVSPSGTRYHRQQQVHFPGFLFYFYSLINQITYFRLCPLTIPAEMHMDINLHYEKLDRIHAWKLLQRDAHSIIAQHGLSIAPHELMLGQWRYTQNKFLTHSMTQLFTFIAHGILVWKLWTILVMVSNGAHVQRPKGRVPLYMPFRPMTSQKPTTMECRRLRRNFGHPLNSNHGGWTTPHGMDGQAMNRQRVK